ncbi:MAG: hydrogenase maturation protease [FCB group bacterium]|nr:hydrogenase maturation protease [FCB group bacterium]
MGSVKFIAVGNPLYGDDGIGKAILDLLQKSEEFKESEFYDAQTDALSIIDELLPDGLNIIVDAAKMNLAAGTVAAFGADEVRLKIKWDHLSLHGFGLAETFNMAKAIQRLPGHVRIVGIEPEIVEINRELSETVKKAIPHALELITNEVRTYESEYNTRN